MIVYEYGDCATNHPLFKQRIYQLPNSQMLYLQKNDVQTSTFLNTPQNDILVQVNHRFLLYDSNGNFIEEVNFRKKHVHAHNHGINHSHGH